MKRFPLIITLTFLILANFVWPQKYLQEYEEGYKLFEEKKLIQAKEHLERILLNYPNHIPSLKLLGEIYTRLNRYEEAIFYYKKVLLINPFDIDSKISLGYVYAWSGKHDRSIAIFKEVIEEEPENIAAKKGLATVLRWSHRFEEAENIYLEILKKDPENVDALKGLAKVYSFLGRFSKALKLIEKSIKISPENSELYKEKGEILAWQNRFQEAEKIYQKALILNPKDPEIYHNLGNLYSWSKKFPKAIWAYRKAHQLAPLNTASLLEMAKVYLQWNKTSQAKEVLLKILKIDSKNAQALKLLQEIKQKSKWNIKEIIEKFIDPIFFISIISIILIYYQRKKHVLKKRNKFYKIFIQYFLPFLLLITIIGFALIYFVEIFKPYAELYTKILILCIIGILAISFYTLARFGSTPKQKRNIILTIGAHPDDIELGCGGTLAKLKDQGSKVYGIIFSSGEKGIKDPKGKEKRKKEAYRVAKYLNFDHLWIYEFKDTELQKNISQMVKKIENRIRELKPDIVFTHSPQDIHQDHQAVFEATKIASRENVSLLCYEDVRTSQEFIPNFFVDIEEYIDDKLKLIKFYKSQRKKQYMDLECIKGRAAHRGLQAGVKYAEAFYVYKIVEK